MNRLLIRDTLRLRPLADAICADWAAIDEADVEVAIRNLRLAEVAGEERFRNAYILLAHSDRQFIIAGADNAGL